MDITTNQQEQLWTVEDIAAWGKISVGTVKNWSSAAGLAAGKLPPPIRLGSAVRWKPAAIAAHFELAA
ncbi:helix-turn-helix domain-containing protein [Salinibacterium sp. ZJ454]|uniref:helix-turn-helix transcriptional regulator n=1 Tax=Salinibacterium sp. ZJ454 TaxID=2708339 RepID=UPI00142130B3|nr:helix-turn-helix domain-containing protein [Salinibacterium sp. ZJ454]